MSRGYRLTEGSVRSINATIRTVNQMRKTGVVGDLPFRQNARKGKTVSGTSGTSYPIMVGKTTSEWLKGNGQIIQPLDATTANPVGDPVSVLNLFATVASGRWVAFARMADNQAILLSAECD